MTVYKSTNTSNYLRAILKSDKIRLNSENLMKRYAGEIIKRLSSL